MNENLRAQTPGWYGWNMLSPYIYTNGNGMFKLAGYWLISERTKADASMADSRQSCGSAGVQLNAMR